MDNTIIEEQILVDEKAEEIIRLFSEGLNKHEVAKELNYEDYRGHQMYMKRHGYVWDEENQNYIEKSKTIVNAKILSIVDDFRINPTGRAATIIAMLNKGTDTREVAKQLKFADHQEMATYMKSKDFIWDSAIKNYKKKFGKKIEEEFEEEIPRVNKSSNSHEYTENVDTNSLSGINMLFEQYGEILQIINENKVKLLEILAVGDIEDAKIPRYALPGVFVTKSVHMTSSLDVMVREFSKDKNISQRDIFVVALVEFFEKYGYKKEVQALING